MCESSQFCVNKPAASGHFEDHTIYKGKIFKVKKFLTNTLNGGTPFIVQDSEIKFMIKGLKTTKTASYEST